MSGSYAALVDNESESYTLEEAARAVVMEAVDAADMTGWVRVSRESLLWLARALSEKETYEAAEENFSITA